MNPIGTIKKNACKSPLNIWLLSGNLVCGLVILGLIQNDSATSSRSDTQTNESSLRASSQIVETNKLFPQDLLQYIESQRAASEAARAALQRESRILVEVQPGDNLSILFARAGFGPQNVADVLNSVSDTGRLARLFPGYQLAFETDQNSTLSSLEVIASPLESFLYKRNQQGDF